MLKAILFDLDGTLVDSNDYHVLAWEEAFRAAGYAFDRRTLHDQIGKGADNYVPALLPDVSEEEAKRIGDAHGPIYKGRYLDRVKPFPGARDLLKRSREAGYKVVLASSASGEELAHYVRLLDAAHLIDACTSADDVGHSKPCPDIFEMARDKASVASIEALVVGDTPYDIDAAAKAGISTVAVRSGGFADSALAGAIAIFDDVAEIFCRFEASPLSRVEEQV